MRATVTVTRVIRQYAEIPFPAVESIEDADAQATEALADPLGKARLLRGVAWFGDDLLEPISVVEVIDRLNP